jgi:hypothetical protein
LNTDILKSIELNPNHLILHWKELKKWILESELPLEFQDHSILKVFVQNFMEYYNEYEVLKECSKEEYSAVLYYFAKKNEESDQAPKGQELLLILRLLSKISTSKNI